MGRRKVHWSEVMTCSCGARFTDYAKEAVHRHNFPALCRKPKSRKAATPPDTKSDPTRADNPRT